MPNFGQFGNATPDTEKERPTVVTGFSNFTDDDFKDKGGLFDPIPKGRYHFVVYDCQTGFTKKDNTLMKTILMDIHHEDGTKNAPYRLLGLQEQPEVEICLLLRCHRSW